MIAALGQAEAQPRIDVGGAIHVVACVDDHMVERCHRQCHRKPLSPPSLVHLGTPGASGFLLFCRLCPGCGNHFQIGGHCENASPRFRALTAETAKLRMAVAAEWAILAVRVLVHRHRATAPSGQRASVEAHQPRRTRMLSNEENELITRTGPGTPMGNAMRRYWVPACLSREIGDPDGAPVRVKLIGEELVAFRDTEGRIGLVEEYLPTSRRVALFWAQRGMRPALRLSRLEVRRDRRLRRSVERAGGTSVQAQGEARGLSDLRARRHRLGISRAGREDAAFAEIRLDPGAGNPPSRDQGHRGMQLPAGARRRDRHLARADPAPAADRQLRLAAA